MLESMGTYYPNDENPRDPDELIWGRYTEEQWELMTVWQRADAFWSYHDGDAGSQRATAWWRKATDRRF